jgi:glycerol-3-phosphate cytidylyltransferase
MTIESKQMTIGFTCSTFDLLHAGHILMLEEARAQCDYLIVGLQVDPTIDRPEKNKPVQSITERYIQLKGCRFVDEIIPYSTEADLLNILTSFPIHVRILGQEYEDREFTGQHLDTMTYYFNRREHAWSSSELRERVWNAESSRRS